MVCNNPTNSYLSLIRNSTVRPIYNCHDDRRNQFFLDRGCVSIRFAEEQIIKHPHSCAAAIAQLIANITNDKPY
jgi:very-short-patch-repair endonuclease